jgi:acetyltransferase-like isoleucine patch superfamily enzyme
MNKLYRLIRYDWPIHFLLLITNWLPDNVVFLRLRGFLISPFFKKCGKNLRVGRNNIFIDSFNIKLGQNIYISEGNWFNGSGEITIDDEVIFGPKSLIVTSNHTKQNNSFRYGPTILKPIYFEKGSWIGGNSTILSGVIVKKGSVVAANSVLN